MLNTTPDIPAFATAITHWQQAQGRHHLPWQGTNDAYRIWLSEIMLQQTQVDTVIGYYTRFLERFPNLQSLAQASLDDVMPFWAGLGYYTRARNLHRCAVQVMEHWNGQFPDQAEQIATLPGIGRSTAAAIAAFAHGRRSPILDGNVKRVFCRYFGIHGNTQLSAIDKKLWALAEQIVEQAPDTLNMAAYTQGLMDLGATRCTRSRPQCAACPLQNRCHAHATNTQSELPTPRQRKTLPERDCALLVIHLSSGILLEKQPSPGIWGGLWSLPRFDTADALKTACLNLGYHREPVRLAGLQHVFSHFRLNIDPWYLHLPDTLPLQETQPHQCWMPTARLETTALPTPIRKILGVVQAGTLV
ncbi:MAG: A/G-specific adenine glycosylase [Alcaligenaceae bacterium]|nr:A/G-specific adenine glycosylase [Alcaligenaceae bacterium]